MEKIKRIALVVTSPLQIMLAHKICEIYNPDYVKCFIITYNGDNRYHRNENLALDYGYAVQPIQVKSYRRTVVKNILSSIFYNRGFDIVIQGMYYGYIYYSLSLKLLRNGGQLLFTDDGINTLNIEDEQVKKFLTRSKIMKGIFEIMKFRKIKYGLFYSIFKNIKNEYFEMRDLNLLNNDKSQVPRGIYFVGTFQEAYMPKFKPSMSDHQFVNLISSTVGYLRDNFPDEEIMYTPHGRESESRTLQICQQMKLRYLPSEVSVEIDYPKNGYYPKIILGFMSTALFTLKAMYPLAKVIDVRPANLEFIFPKALEKLNLSEDSLDIYRLYFKV